MLSESGGIPGRPSKLSKLRLNACGDSGHEHVIQ